MGKYTLQVNKHQEYESCPRYEMQFFSGDGAVDAWIDEYAFGSQELMNASLSVKHEESSTGVLFTDKWNRSAIQWDYFAWRIICIHLHYKATGDKAFLERYYEEARTDLLWQLERLNSKHLIFQRPCFASSFRFLLGQTEWTCSAARIGEKTSLNALLYKSLTAMAELAREMNEEENARRWLDTAETVKNAINEHLWSEEKQSYMDSLDEFVAQDANTFAILFGVADEKRAEAALETMKKRLGSPYGSAILDHIKKSKPQKDILLNVELLDETADNYGQRVRRFKFYQKNGFFDTGYNIDEVGGTFRVLSTRPTFEVRAYQRAFQKITLGLWKPKITKVEEK